MKIKEKTYPYPVIKEGDADYRDYEKASFDFDVSVNDDSKELNIKIHTENIPDKLIPGKVTTDIKYGYQIESTFNKNRQFYLSDDSEYSIELNAEQYIRNVEINAYIIASKAIKINFDSKVDKVDKFYDGEITFPKGGIIAVSRPTKVINVKLDDGVPENPIRIVKNNTINSIRYTIDNSQIKIELNEKNHDIYARFGKDKRMLEFVFNSIVTPAVSKALLELSQGDINDDSNWGMNFKDKLEDNDVYLDDIKDNRVTVEEATQIILGSPINKMFDSLKEYGENNNG